MKSHHLLRKIAAVAVGSLMMLHTVFAEDHLRLSTNFEAADYFSGAMFDVVATSNIMLTEIGFHTSATTTIDVSLYTRVGTYVDNEMDESMWTFVETKNVDGNGGGSSSPFPLDDPIMMLKGEKRAFYISTVAGPFIRGSKVSDLNAGSEAYANDDVVVEVGAGKRRGWSGSLKTAIFDGEFKYDLLFFPTTSPTESPTMSPTTLPSSVPSSQPSKLPSNFPSISVQPSPSPTNFPSTTPTSLPTPTPSTEPSTVPTISQQPSESPSDVPSYQPSESAEPSSTPTTSPSGNPSASPSSHPSVDLDELTIRTYEFNAVKDTYIEMGSNNTHGNDAELFVDGDPKRVTLIKFDISSLNGGTEDAPITVYDVKLKLHALRDSASGGSVSVYYSLDFDEEDANWESDGSWADLTETYHVGDLGLVTKENPIVTIDMLDAFRKKLPTTFSIRITSDSSDGVSYRSREGVNGATKEKNGPKAIFSFAYEPASHAKLADTFGTDEPTQSPTITKTWPDNPVPSSTTNRYFNYDPSDQNNGPERWGAKRSFDFDHLGNLRTSQSNKCKGGSRQSPRDVCSSGTKHSCWETHQIRRNSRGDFGFDPDLVSTPKAEILPHCLRLEFPERRGWDSERKESRPYPDVPRADFSRNGYNSGEQPMTHIDIKTKSEHKICGRRYDVELQYYYLHKYGNFEATAILGQVELDGDGRNGHNREFQKILNFFQKQADKDLSACNTKRRRARALLRANKTSGDQKPSTPVIESSFQGGESELTSSKSTPGLHHRVATRFLNILNQRDLNKKYRFDFYHNDLWRTEWFIAYQGSMTYPPCAEKINWRVLDTVFTISKAQLRQLKNIQFEHVNRDTCMYDSVHHDESNAREIQRYRGGKYYRCTRKHYVSDDEKEDSGSRRGYSSRSKWEGPDGLPFFTPAAGLSST